MLIFATFFLIALLISTIVIWLYRFIANWEGFNQLTVSNPSKNAKRWSRTHQRFNPSASPVRGRAKTVALSSGRGNIKTPWGW